MFEEAAIHDEILWVAAELAEEYMELEAEGAQLANARARTPAQEEEYSAREQQLHDLAERILSLVSPATI